MPLMGILGIESDHMAPRKLVVVRISVILHVLASAWFFVAPDFLPDVLIDAERLVERPVFLHSDVVLVVLSYLQTIVSVFMWRPNRGAAALYFAVTLSLVIVGALSSPSQVSAIDASIGHLQTLASGVLIAIFLLDPRANREV